MKKMAFYLFTFLLLVSCERFKNKDTRNVAPNEHGRWVCISKQYTEIIFALGVQKNLVAVDLSSTYPPDAKKLPTIGYHRALSAEAILAMKPDMILHDNNIGPDHVVKQLQDLNIPMKTFGKYSASIEGTDSLIKEMGRYFNQEKKSDSICKVLHIEYQKALANTQKFRRHPRVLIIHYGRAMNIYLVMTKKSIASKMIEWAGGTLVTDGDKPMQPLSAEIIAQANPDVILVTDYGYDRLNQGNDIFQLPGISSTRAFKNNSIYRIEEHDIAYLGPRTGQNILLLQKLLHPDEK